MSNGITAMWDDSEHYKSLAHHFGVSVRTNGSGNSWPYNMDSKHYDELLKLYRTEKDTK